MIERSIAFGPENGLVGTVALPEAAPALAGIGFVLLNAGSVHRVGPHRLNVRVARELAASGIPSIRFDLAGHGDSARLTGEHSFEAQAVVDIRAAMDALGSIGGLGQFVVFGFCSGAYHGFRAALSDERVTGLLMFDAFRYPTVSARLAQYLAKLRKPLLGRRLLGRLRREAAHWLPRGVARGGAAGREDQLVPRLDFENFIPEKEEVGQELRLLLSRGVAIAMIYSGGVDRCDYAKQFQRAFAGFGITDQIGATFLPDIDHQATGIAEQADLMHRVVAWGRRLTLRPQGAAV